ncbi:MAG TPA: four helix bundle protein [Candidatus Acidoferrales bacterium]|nr:four helix bundle protein [Candidatus Acidoferrales bacterium]
MKIKSFSELTVWQGSHELALMVYKLTASFPRSEMFGTVSQLRRASASVPANIAQGFGRRTTRELLRSLQIAAGEMEEVRYFLILGRDLGYVAAPGFDRASALCDSVGQLIKALGRSLKQRGGTT